MSKLLKCNFKVSGGSGMNEGKIEKIVEALRAKGELDEQKWEIIQKDQNRIRNITFGISAFLLISAIFRMDLLSIIFSVAISYFLIVHIFKKSSQEMNTCLYLFYCGIKKEVVIEDISSHYGIGYAYTKILFNVDDSGKHNEVLVPHKFMPRNHNLKDNDTIEIIYDPNNKKLQRYCNEELNNYYNIKAGKDSGNQKLNGTELAA